VEGFRPGVMDRLGIGPKVLAERNPRLVYCALTGYGQDGPYVNLVGHDVNYISQAGALGLNGPADRPPAIPGFQFADFAGGALMAAFGILLALVARQGSGRGQMVDAALTEGVLGLIANQFSYLQVQGSVPPRGQSRLSGGEPYYNVYECADGKHVSIGCNEPYFWANLCRIVGREDFIPDQDAEGARKDEIFAALREIFRTRPRDEWFELLYDADVCVGRVLALDELPSDPQHQARGMFVSLPAPDGGTVTQVGVVPRLSDTPGQVRRVAPKPGEQTGAILAELGYTPERVAALRVAGAVE
ncbi:MAG: CoA transferase, partial [Chloroflexi bacterium]|nr:CoA transferase [Chloroflexota bacterium]